MAATERSTERSGAGRFLPLAVLAAGLVIFFALGLHRYLSFGALAENRDYLIGLVEDHPVAAPLAFMVVYALAVAFSIPGAVVLTIAGGFLFGTWAGGIYVVLGATSGPSESSWPPAPPSAKACAGVPAPGSRGLRRVSGKMPSAICWSCGWCRCSLSGWSIWSRRSSASR